MDADRHLPFDWSRIYLYLTLREQPALTTTPNNITLYLLTTPPLMVNLISRL
jgi:hypothetical protein